MIKEVLDDLATVAKAIENTKKIIDAIKEGTDYVNQTHPDIKEDLKSLIIEIQKTMVFIAEASAVLTQFRFSMSLSDLRAFNDYFILHKEQVQLLRNHIDDLRTHCSKIRDHSQKISGKKGKSGFKILIGKLGVKSQARERELANTLDRLAYEDFEFANSAELMVRSIERALEDVQNTLGNYGMMYQENIPKTAELLSEYAKKFEALEKSAADNAAEIQKTVMELK